MLVLAIGWIVLLTLEPTWSESRPTAQARFAFGVFGWVTATLATLFVGRDADSDEAALASAKPLAGRRGDVSALRGAFHALSTRRTP